MRLIKGIVNAVLMATLIKPMVRLTIGRWRKRVQESPAAALGIGVQEMFEAALLEELAPVVAEPEVVEGAVAEAVSEAAAIETIEAEAGRSAFRILLMAGVLIAATTAVAYGIAALLKRRRAAQVAERDLVAVPIQADPDEAIDDVAIEALVGEG
jgi:hypothetical protein